MPPPRPGTRWVTDFFSYETTKSVVVKSWVVGAINRGVQLLILTYFIGWVFLHEKAYQVRDTVIESSVVTKVKGIGHYAGRVLDTADYVTPHQGTSVFVVVTKQILTENQAQGVCPESEAEYRCTADRDCRGKSPATGSGVLTGRCVPYNGTLRTCEIRGWCPPEVDTVDVPVMLEAENFTLFIKNSIRFPLFGFEKHARYYRWQDGTERRTLTKAFGIRFDVLVYGNVRAGLGAFPRTLEGPWRVGTPLQRVSLHSQAGKFGIVPTLINTVAAFTSIGVGTVLCDIILLNFLKGAEHYKARKFEEVPEAGVPAPPTSPTACPPGALGGCSRDKQSTDSGTFSLGL
ncbi:P2X purinoceptor 3 isoform X10 [Calonectris borealis]|uniref:P2X purinoceptor 3 isoform X10 n=1 Tax=Calonectris borealis TaxID=1323832 RepID=UPI003F4B7F6E